MDSAQLLQFAVTGIVQGAIYALVAAGFNLVYSATGIINFAQGEFVMLGGLLAVTGATLLHLPLVLAILLPVVVVMGLGAAMHWFTIRPLKHAHMVTLIMVTIGVSVAVRGGAKLIWGADPQPLPAFSGGESLQFGGAMIEPQSLWVLGIAAGAGLLLAFFFRRTLVGRAMAACALNRRAAELVGIRPDLMNMWAFALAGGIGALAGGVLAPLTFASFDIGVSLALKGFCAAVLGGIGSNSGAIVGGLLLGLVESMGAGYISSGYKDAFAFAILLLVLFLRPSGLLNVLVRRDEE
ncbi:MAG TPA: branched-chain amino acid ABC transporter permease [Armatimonadota bacterium]|jgi:branched-chain amino acid transport system permease protein